MKRLNSVFSIDISTEFVFFIFSNPTVCGYSIDHRLRWTVRIVVTYRADVLFEVVGEMCVVRARVIRKTFHTVFCAVAKK